MNISALMMGRGSIGFRNLQGLGKIPAVSLIYLQEDTKERSERLRELCRADPHLSQKQLIFLQNIEDLSQIPDLVLSTVTAAQQISIHKEIFDKFQVAPRIVILETPIASGRQALAEILQLIPNAYVNSTRSLWPGYIRLKRELAELTMAGQRLKFEFIGNMRGIGSNGVNYIQLFRMLSGARELRVKKANLTPTEHRRQGDYVEFEGELIIEADERHEFHLVCTDVAGGIAIFEPPSIFVKDFNEKILFRIDEPAGRIHPHEGERYELGQLFVSDSIQIAVDGILEHGESRLPGIKDSTIDHLALFDALDLALGEKTDFGIG